MLWPLLLLVLGLCWVPAPSSALVADLVHHELRVRLSPANRSLAVTDRIAVPVGFGVGFALHAGLSAMSPER